MANRLETEPGSPHGSFDGSAPPRVITVQTPLASPSPTKVKSVPAVDRIRCNPGVICARGTAVHGENSIVELNGKIYGALEPIPGPPPQGSTAGAYSGQDWYFDKSQNNEIYHAELALKGGVDFVLAVWVRYSDDFLERLLITFRVGTIGNATECDECD